MIIFATLLAVAAIVISGANWNNNAKQIPIRVETEEELKRRMRNRR